MRKDQVTSEADLHELLFERAGSFRGGPVPIIRNHHRWAVVSSLQKAVRRGHVGHAVTCAATMLDRFPQYDVYRRLSVIALEDVGPGDWLTVALALCAARSRRFVQKVGARPVLLSLTQALTEAPKSRSLADVGNLERFDAPAELPWLPRWITDRSKSLEGLGRAVPAVWSMTQCGTDMTEHPPDLPGDELIGGVLASAFDKHVREGKEAIRRVFGGKGFSPKQVELVLFYLEGCHVDRVLTFPGEHPLTIESHEADYRKYGFPSLDAVPTCDRPSSPAGRR